MKIGIWELAVVFIVALLVLGPDRLPQYARRFGAALREFRKASSEVTQELRESVIDPLEEAQKPLREAAEPLEDLGRDLKADLKSVEKGLNDLGRTRPAKEQPAPAQTHADQHESPDAEAPGKEGGDSV